MLCFYSMKQQNRYKYISAPEQLEEFCSLLKNEQWISLDTEFLREKTYYPQLCLIQIATPEHAACIDPLELKDISPLLDIIYDPAITKVLHAARQDLEIFYNLKGTLPKPVFDTQLAAPLLGYADNIGYANLVQKILGINLEKAHSRTDWTKRPLNEKQLDYAAHDVIYLAELYTHLKKNLQERQRLHWLDREFEALCDTNLYSNPPQDAWQRIKFADRLKGSSLSILQALAKWREETAKNDNRPRNWIMRDEVIIDIARTIPESPEKLSHIRGLNERSLRKYGKKIVALVNSSKNTEPLSASKKPYYKTALTGHQEELADLLQVLIRSRANENSLNPTTLATRKTLEKFILGHPCDLDRGWKYHMVGQDLQDLMNGKKIVTVKDKKVYFQ